MKIYLASPFFSPEQKALVKELEENLESWGHIVYSPSRDGGILKKDATSADKIRTFGENVGCIHWCDCVVAVINDWDKGVLFEIGFSYGIGKPIIAFTDKDYGMNVMLSEAVVSFAKGHFDLHDALKGMNKKWERDVE